MPKPDYDTMMNLIRTHFAPELRKAVTFERWKDGIEVDYPCYAIEAFAQAAAAVIPLPAKTLAEWHEDFGPVVWWRFCRDERPDEASWIGTPLDDDWPGYHTHWTPHPPIPTLT